MVLYVYTNFRLEEAEEWASPTLSILFGVIYLCLLVRKVNYDKEKN